MNQRIYKPYHQYISEAEKLSDDEFYKLIDEIESVCCSRLQIEEYIKKHNNKWNSVGTTIEGNQMVKIPDKNRLNALIELCSFVNKVTKTIDIDSALENGQISDKIQKVIDVEFTKEEIEKIQKWELKDTEKRYIDIFNRLKSQSDKDRKKGMKQLCELSNKELSEYAWKIAEKLGCYAIVLECIPAALAAKITKAVSIPTIGIGAGVECDGQVLVLFDMLGMSGFKIRFVRQYLNGLELIKGALNAYSKDVHEGAFPSGDEIK